MTRDVLPEKQDAARWRPVVLARQHRHQLLLAVAADASDADDLTGAHLQLKPLEFDRERIGLGQVQRLHLQHDLAGLHGAVRQRRRLGADHQA